MKNKEDRTVQSTNTKFPRLGLHSTKKGETLVISTGQRLELGKVHPAALEHLFTTIKTINRLAQDPTMISYDSQPSLQGAGFFMSKIDSYYQS